MINVKIVYRNYKPLHDLYASFVTTPPQGVSFAIPSPRKHLRRFYPLYIRFGDNFLARKIISGAQRFLFDTKDEGAFDILHFAQMMPRSIPTGPYVIDFEHVAALGDFLELDQVTNKHIRNFLGVPQCCKIMPLSCAAQRSLENLFDESGSEIMGKTEVVYPALPNHHAIFRDQVDRSYTDSHSDEFRVLFIGNDVKKKGLYELLAAFRVLERRYDDITLCVVSDAPRQAKEKYCSPRIKYFAPKYSHDEIIKKFYIPCDLFVLPTHGDTFGMAILYSLSCGTPVLTTRQFASPEMITPGYNGLFLQANSLYLEETPFPNRKTTKSYYKDLPEDSRLIDDLVNKIEYLYFNRDVLRNMSKQAVKDFEPGGKFSIAVRNRKLGEIYRTCLC